MLSILVKMLAENAKFSVLDLNASQGAKQRQLYLSALRIFNALGEEPRFAQLFTPSREVLDSFGLDALVLGTDRAESQLASDLLLKFHRHCRDKFSKLSDLSEV